jgi:Ca-activated chloride channel family protein
MTDMMGIHWAGIDRIIALPLLLLAIVFIIRNYQRIKKGVHLLVHPLHTKHIFKNFSLRAQLSKSVFLILAFIFIFLAFLQPQWGKKEQVIAQEGRDVLIVLDISRSMTAKDLSPTRLDFAKLKIRTLLSKMACERVGLIIFSGSAFVQCPLTIDHAAFLMFLEQVDTESISSGTTAIDKALSKALDVFSSSPDRKNKLVVLLTDGEDFSTDLQSVQSTATQENVHLFALGIGSTEGAPIPKINPDGSPAGHETDENGNIVLSTLNENMLQKLCTTLNGHYLRATYDDSDVDTIVSKIMRYEKEKFSDRKMSLYEDQYPWLLGLAWICLILEWIL